MTDKHYDVLKNAIQEGMTANEIAQYISEKIENGAAVYEFLMQIDNITYNVFKFGKWFSVQINPYLKYYSESEIDIEQKNYDGGFIVPDKIDEPLTDALNNPALVLKQKTAHGMANSIAIKYIKLVNEQQKKEDEKKALKILQDKCKPPITINMLKPGMKVRIKPLEEARKCKWWKDDIDFIAGSVWEIKFVRSFYIILKITKWIVHPDTIAEIVEEKAQDQEINSSEIVDKIIDEFPEWKKEIIYGKNIGIDYAKPRSDKTAIIIGYIPPDTNVDESLNWINDDPETVPKETDKPKTMRDLFTQQQLCDAFLIVKHIKQKLTGKKEFTGACTVLGIIESNIDLPY